MELVDKDDDINSLCKKLFAPHLCEEPVKELKRTLENKLITQFYKFAEYLWEKK